jgi:secondary thiamine-phosphate synthase enzyme
MRQELTEIELKTQGRAMIDFTDEVCSWVSSTGIRRGLLTLQIGHTSASLLVQENYDPTVQSDLERFLQRLVPDGDPIFRHTIEGPDDMPAHVRAALTSTTLSLPVDEGRPTLGTWQGIYLFEHRHHGHRRRVTAHLLGE